MTPTTDATPLGTHPLAAALDAVLAGRQSLGAALGLHPKVLDLLTDKAIGLLQHGKLAEAESLLRSLAEVDSRSPSLSILLGATLAAAGRPDRAAAAYAEAIARAERAGVPRIAARARLCRAHALLDLGRSSEARRELELAASDGGDALVVRAAHAALAQARAAS